MEINEDLFLGDDVSAHEVVVTYFRTLIYLMTFDLSLNRN